MATVRHPGIQAAPVRSVVADSGLQGLAIVLTSLDLPSSPVRRVKLFLQGPVVPHVG